MADNPYTAPVPDVVTPSHKQMAAFNARAYDGLITLDGTIVNATHNGLVSGSYRDASPEYWRFLDSVDSWAHRYPFADPRTWVPLAQAQIQAGTLVAETAITGDTIAAAQTGATVNPVGTRTTNDVPPPEDTGGGGIGGFISGAIGFVTSPAIAADKWFNTTVLPHTPEPIRHAADNVGNAVGHGWSGTLGSEWLKTASRNFFAAMQMPQQAIVGTTANVADDLKKGDLGGALMHTIGIIPTAEAAAIGIENATGTDFYRSHGPTNWSQTDMGQILLDIAGQGRGEQFGWYNDPTGMQSNEGTGYFIRTTDQNPPLAESAPSDVSSWQRAQRLAANTLVPEQQISVSDRKQLMHVLNTAGEQQAIEWAAAQGYTWDEMQQTFIKPAQGFTPGRFLALQFTNPNTSAYNNLSGLVDGVWDLTADPTNWIPGGAIKEGALAVRGGAKIVGEGSKAIAISRGIRDIASHGEIVDALRNAPDIATGINDLTKGGAQLMIRTKAGDLIPASAEEAARIAKQGNFSRNAKKLVLQAEIDKPVSVGNEVGQRIAEAKQMGLKDPRKNMADGLYYTTDHAWTWLDSEDGQNTVRALVANENPADIWMRAGGRIDLVTAAKLSNADTPAAVREILAPLLGVNFQRTNDTLGLVKQMPTYSLSKQLWRATDIAQFQLRARQFKGMEFMPVREVHPDDLNGIMENTLKLIHVAVPGAQHDAQIINLLKRAADITPGDGLRSRALTYQLWYGRPGEEIVRAADGSLLAPADALAADRILGKTDNEILAQYPPGAKIDAETTGGIMERLKNIMIDRGVNPTRAREVTTAWSDPEIYARAYGRDLEGRPLIAPWSDQVGSEPMIDADMIQGGFRFPDPVVMREQRIWVGKLERLAEHSDHQWVKDVGGVPAAIDRIMTNGILHWKQLALLQGGARLPAYIMRMASDGLVAMGLNGGASLFHKPLDMMHMLVAAAVQHVEQADIAGAAHLSYLRRSSTNPIIRSLWSDALTHDIVGNDLGDLVRRAANGDVDVSNMDIFNSMNASVGLRGAKGMDIQYAAKAANEKRWSYVDDPAADNRGWRGYKQGMLNEITRWSHSEVAVAVAAGKTEDEIFRTLVTHAFDQRSALMANPRAAAFLSTEDGLRQYIRFISRSVKDITGEDPELLDVIAHGGNTLVDGKRVPVLSHATRFEPKPTQAWHDLMKRAHERTPQWDAANPNQPGLPKVVATYDTGRFGGKGWWDSYNGALFAFSGLVEDRLIRDPWYRERYFAHVEQVAGLMDSESRRIVADTLQRHGSPDLAAKIRKIQGEGPLDAKMVDIHAKQEAAKDMLDVAYDAANRREWAFAMRLLSPFAQAAVNGMYRWAKAAVQNPESTYRVLRPIKYLTGPDSAALNTWLGTGMPGSQPFIYEDPTTGDRRVAIPLLGALASKLLSTTGLPGIMPATPGTHVGYSFGASTGLNMGFQQGETAAKAEAAGIRGQFWAMNLFPGIGPIAEMPLSLMSNHLPNFVANYVFPYGKPTGSGTEKLVDALFPHQWSTFLNLVNPGPEDKLRMASSAMQFTVMLSEKYPGGWANMTDSQRLAVSNQAQDLASAMHLIGVLGSFGTPSAAVGEVLFKSKNDIPDHLIFADNLSKWWQNYLTGAGGDYYKAQSEFITDFGLDALMLTAPTNDRVGGAPPTHSAEMLYESYRHGYDLYNDVLTTLLPQRDGTDFDIQMYQTQIANGERRQLTYRERVDTAQQTLLGYIADYQFQRIANDPTMTDSQRVVARNDARQQLVAQGWEGSMIGRTPEQRDKAANLMLAAAQDQRMWPFMGGQTTATFLSQYLSARAAMEQRLRDAGGTGDLATATTSGSYERQQLFLLGEAYALQNPTFSWMWDKSLRSEVAPE